MNTISGWFADDDFYGSFEDYNTKWYVIGFVTADGTHYWYWETAKIVSKKYYKAALEMLEEYMDNARYLASIVPGEDSDKTELEWEDTRYLASIVSDEDSDKTELEWEDTP
jgi:hypothetical protein